MSANKCERALISISRPNQQEQACSSAGECSGARASGIESRWAEWVRSGINGWEQ